MSERSAKLDGKIIPIFPQQKKNDEMETAVLLAVLVGMLSCVVFLYLQLKQRVTRRDDAQSWHDEELTSNDVDAQVIIVGGGPVGTVLATLLLQKDISTMVIEQRKDFGIDTGNTHHSKAIGIHPPSLEIFEKIDKELVSKLCEVSVVVKEGIALANGYDDILGELALYVCRKPFNFVLSCPQHKSESILRQTLIKAAKEYNERNKTSKKILVTGESVQSLAYENNVVTVTTDTGKYTAHFAIGCDGKRSIVRETSASITYTGSPYCDTFVMGDFEDNTGYDAKAAIFLADDGMVECFPLPGNMRRWVCSTDSYIKETSREFICELVKRRTKYDIYNQKNTMVSTYGVQGYVVNQFYENEHCRFVVAGDAAHICSPLGGQGMNLGWRDAWELSHRLENILKRRANIRSEIELYNKQQIKLAKAVIHRAELNMVLGRKPKWLKLRNWFVRFCLIPILPFQYTIASFFTMRWLGNLSLGNLTLV